MSKTSLFPKLSMMDVTHHHMPSNFTPIHTTLRITHGTESELRTSAFEEKYVPLDKFLTLSSFMKQKEPLQPRPTFKRVKADCHQQEVTLHALENKTPNSVGSILEATVMHVVNKYKGF